MGQIQDSDAVDNTAPTHPPANGLATRGVRSTPIHAVHGRADDEQAVLLLATHTSLAVTHVRAIHLAEIEAQQLHRAIQTRDVIGQAKGILIARHGMTADEAFDVLRRTSQDLNVKLVDLARVLAQRPESLDEF